MALRDWAKGLTYAEALKALEANSARVIGQLTLVGTLITAGGIIVTETLLKDGTWWSKGFVFGAAFLASVAILCVLLYQFDSVRELELNDLADARRILRELFWRSWLVTVAQALMILAALSGAVGGSVFIIQESTAEPDSTQPNLTATWATASAKESNQPLTSIVSVSSKATGLTAGDHSQLVVTKKDGSPYAKSIAVVDETGTLEQKLDVSGLALDDTIRITFEAGNWSCIGELDSTPSAAPIDCSEK